jgi:hypothetical protein
MAKDFSWKTNDKLAVAVADKLRSHFPQDTTQPGAWEGLLDYLAKYAGATFEEVTNLINGLGNLSNAPKDVFRLALAIIHCRDKEPAKDKAVKAHARILQITVDGKQKKFPKVSLHMLVVSSRHAGKYMIYQADLKEAVKLHRSIYSGRALKYAGRSLLEFVGCVATIYIRDALVVSVSADAEERKLNKQLCVDRCQADVSCHEASQCCFCKKGKHECRLAVRT